MTLRKKYPSSLEMEGNVMLCPGLLQMLQWRKMERELKQMRQNQVTCSSGHLAGEDSLCSSFQFWGGLKFPIINEWEEICLPSPSIVQFRPSSHLTPSSWSHPLMLPPASQLCSTPFWSVQCCQFRQSAPSSTGTPLTVSKAIHIHPSN